MERFLTLKYYFVALPDPNFQFTKLTFAVGLLLLLAGVALGIYRKKYLKDVITKKIIRKYPGLLKTYGLLVLILLLVRETGIPYLSMRIWWVVFLIFFLYSVIKFLYTYRREYKKRSVHAHKRSINKKYLPAKKR
ncbi:hypothetical protein KJ742_06065 [Patescibacteria group bacterium]|nr:hypothetical protein [Patescibacteria group bacterium]MBU1683482.1 hypothetical protein [Patescibacteria group bacterium]